jgi:hypothetical protein
MKNYVFAAHSLKRLRFWFCLGLLAMSEATIAAPGDVAGLVDVIRSHDPTVGNDWFSLVGVTSVGACTGALFMFKEDERAKRQVALVLAAKATGKQVRVGYDDTNAALKNGVYCYVGYIDIL